MNVMDNAFPDETGGAPSGRKLSWGVAPGYSLSALQAVATDLSPAVTAITGDEGIIDKFGF